MHIVSNVWEGRSAVTAETRQIPKQIKKGAGISLGEKRKSN